MELRWLAIAALACSCDAFSASVDERELCIPKELSLPGFDIDGQYASFAYTFPLNITLPDSMTAKDYEAHVTFSELRAYPLYSTPDLSFVRSIDLSIRAGYRPWRVITSGEIVRDDGGIFVEGVRDDISDYVLDTGADVAADITAAFPADDWSVRVEFCFAFRLTYH